MQILHYFKDFCIDLQRAPNLCEHYWQNHLGRACPRPLPYPPEIKLAKKSPPQHGPRITNWAMIPRPSWLTYDQILPFLKQFFFSNFTFWWESFLTDHWRKSFPGISSLFLASIHPEPSGITQKTLLTPDQKLGPSGRQIDKPTGINFSCHCNPQFTTMVVAAKDVFFVSPTIDPTESNYPITNFLSNSSLPKLARNHQFHHYRPWNVSPT